MLPLIIRKKPRCTDAHRLIRKFRSQLFIVVPDILAVGNAKRVNHVDKNFSSARTTNQCNRSGCAVSCERIMLVPEFVLELPQKRDEFGGIGRSGKPGKSFPIPY